ncbi:Na+/H+ antiporter [Quadrisphaera sp. DSM 44207]|uniref:Na+/H+ antiporter n=1 Tax=Quadrisphaera sp. DSM 44207 TaxID=1881057 RepID=UPI0008805B24|nr:Na+/H+ antiporter [Quadrisphaera sp. DSM 44207]SDQ73745.1 sodium/proton antiporter, CPA1 family [Quadrisphaera sp. DSM 44207]
MEESGGIGLLVGVAAATTLVAGLAERFRYPAPLVLLVVGAVAAVVPWVPTVPLEPHVVLEGVLPPLLYAAAIRSSLTDFTSNRRGITLLSVGLVVVTTLVVGAVVAALLPVPLWAAFALGAVVAPPDAVAATAVARGIGMPRRVVTVLEGESLVNDATALVCLRTALAAGAAGSVSWAGTLGDFAVSAGGGFLVGAATAWVLGRVRARTSDAVLSTAVSLLAPFVAYLPAEHLGASGVLAVVVTGLLLSHSSLTQLSGAARLSEQTNWRTIQFLLENAVFLLIGLQADDVVVAVAASDVPLARTALVCAAVLATTVLVRPAWVYAAAAVIRRLTPPGHREPVPDARSLAVISWAGMRGVVTLAAVFALPQGTPYREVLVLAAFVVAAATLLGQGATLPWLVRRLGLPGPDPAQDALLEAAALQQAHRAGLARLEELLTPDVPPQVLEQLRERSGGRADALWERLGSLDGREPPTVQYARLRRAMLEAERASLVRLRDERVVPHEVLRRVQEVLDVEESLLDRSVTEQASSGVLRALLDLDADARTGAPARAVVGTRPPGAPGSACPELRAAPGGADGLPLEAAERSRPLDCAGCREEGTSAGWTALRRCLTCGYVGCCDSSPRRHATRHFEATGHPVMRSAEPGEAWRWCYVHSELG